ncbi:MAG: DOMON-like domain-containing protein, partial [Deltaproteobacteria bacterium]|nr:DOMON-like domain-containing protein [Deltaproteobacteria bacterium]
MKERRFALQPLEPEAPPPRVEITGVLTRRAETFSISYLLQGRLSDVLIPAPLAVPVHCDRLWEKTCFEFFLGLKDSKQYWEFNLSPNGSWNVYRFNGYRQGMAAETAFASLPVLVQHRPESLRLTLEVDLAGIVPANRVLEVAVAAVIQKTNGRLTYWALTHPGLQA